MLSFKALKRLIPLLLFVSYQCSSAEDNQQLQIRTIAVSPYGIESATEHAGSGIYYDLANTLVSTLSLYTDFQLDHKIYPYARIIHELKTGQTDLTIMFRYKELKDYVTYISPLPTLSNIVIGLKGSEFANIQALEGKTLAYLRGAKFSDDIDNNTKIFKITTKDFHQGIDLLIAGRVDAIIGPSDPILIALASIEAKEDLFGTPLTVSERTPWVQISNKSPLMSSIPLIKEHIEHLLSRGELENLRARYLLHKLSN